jgi:hypothetical protein
MILVTLAPALRSQPACSAQEACPEHRSYYVEFGLSAVGQYTSTRLSEGSYPARLFPGVSIGTLHEALDRYAGSPSLELGTNVSGRALWVFAGIEMHPEVAQYDGNSDGFGTDSACWVNNKTIRGSSLYLGAMLEKRFLPFAGLYGRITAGRFHFDQTVEVSERFGPLHSRTFNRADVTGLGGTLGGGVFVKIAWMKIRAGYRMLYAGDRDGGSVVSEDFRLALAVAM